MERLLVAAFPSDAQAYEGLRALEDLDRLGTITVYATAVIAADMESGVVTVKQAADPGPLGTPVALLTGSLLGPLAGLVGIAVAAGAGTLGRVLYDLARIGIDEDFLTEVGEALRPGAAAVVAEVWEERITPMDARISALGGTALRRVRKEIVDGQIERDVAALRAELASLTAELGSAPEEHRPYLEERIDAARTKLRAAQQRAKALLDALTKESEAKIARLEAKAVDARGEERDGLAARIAELRSQFRRRGERVCLSLIRDAAADLTGLSTIARDITEQKRAERELRAASQYARGLIEASLDPLVTISPEGKITDVNGATKEATGRARADLIGTDFADYFTEPERAREGYRQVLSQGLVRDYALTLRHVSGRTMDVLYNATVYRDEGGRPQGVFAAARDVTARRRMEEQLRQSQKLEAIGSLAGGVAHDFNNLLTAIIGSCDLLLSRMPEFDPLREEAQEIGTAARKAATLTQRLLTFSRKQVVQPRVLDVDGIVAGMDRMLRRLIGENIDLAVIPGPTRGRIKVDPGQLEQVIVNLVVNARDAMPRGGRLTIETADVEIGEDEASRRIGLKPGHHVLLAVSDTGTGMDAEVQSHLFEPFFTTKEVGKGSGLGLSTVYGIVKQAGGDVSVYSEPGRGSVFKIYLPRAEETVEVAGTAPRAAPMARGKETVLLVEDEPQVRAVTVRVLRSAGYTVLEAADGEEALRVVAEAGSRAIDALVTDVVMPRMGGEELAARVRAERPRIKVLFVSGYTERGAGLESRSVEGAAFLQKPFTPSMLAHEIRSLLNGSGGPAAAPP